MRKVMLLMHVSLDGFVAGPKEEMDWIGYDDNIFQDAIELASTADTSLYGRVTYQMMESYWPTVLSNPASTKLEIHHAQWLENVQKVVFSKSLENVTWNNAKLIQGDIAEEMAKLKQQPGKNMLIFGSPTFSHALMQLGLIDEYRLNVSPVVLGNGNPLFKDINDKINLKLLDTKTFEIGVVGLHYQTIR
jgi:dihydrofolate reductase